MLFDGEGLDNRGLDRAEGAEWICRMDEEIGADDDYWHDVLI